MVVAVGIGLEQVGSMTFREVDYYVQAHRSRLDHDWEQTRLIAACLTGKRPQSIVKLSREKQDKIDWTPELANEVLKRFKLDGDSR